MCSHQPSTQQPTQSTGPIKSPTESTKDNKTTDDRTEDPKVNEIQTKKDKFTEILTRERKYNALKKLEVTSPKNAAAATATTTTQKPAASSPEPTVCYVMGVMYKLGEVLPRDTGTCLECSCSEGARVTCRPKDCAIPDGLKQLRAWEDEERLYMLQSALAHLFMYYITVKT
ncbi:UNVERIFIED_CONTAM: hypothetical protein PYX00_001029 [Menopon gallinae]|uniref:Uncharacterized protein n=1 Tax=Menopon gallinae TaxID=328185 RepID=A0AAW2ICQ3_9NEOP